MDVTAIQDCSSYSMLRELKWVNFNHSTNEASEMQPPENVEEQTVVETSVTGIDNSLEDEQDEDAISKFLSETCGCT